VIALLVLLLILLPLYLWPLRGGLGALPWAATPMGSLPKDPRDPSAMAGIPSDVWEALLNESSGAASGSADPHDSHAPQNLTMITQHEAGDEPGIPELGSSELLAGLLSSEESPPGPLAGAIGPTEGKSGNEDPSFSSTPSQLGNWRLAGGGQGNAGPWPSGGGGGGGAGGRGLPIVLSGLPFGGDEPSFSPPVVLGLGSGDPVAPHPAPEPGMVALVGLNVLLLSGVAWNHRRYKEARPRIR
jgi:hypothetical protein